MIAHGVRAGWQTILADLSLILFMVTAAALTNSTEAPSDSEGGAAARQRPAPQSPRWQSQDGIEPAPRAQPIAVWRPSEGAPALGDWLAEVAHDPRLRLTITVHYAQGRRDNALAEALRLGRSAGPLGLTARIVVEPGEHTGAAAAIGYDADAASGTLFAGKGA